MPKRADIKSVLIIGAGPIVIGQACEFDYSGAQACKALREEGVPGHPWLTRIQRTIMTDPDMADAIYIETDRLAGGSAISLSVKSLMHCCPTMGGLDCIKLRVGFSPGRRA